MAPLFSVIIPLYNKADTICRTLDSVLSQRFSAYEIVIVNDGSTDDSEDIVKRFAGEHPAAQIRLISKSNEGVSATRNRGVQEAAGKYVCFLDADDAWLPDFLSECVRILEKYPAAKVLGTATNQGGGGSHMFGFGRRIRPVDFYAMWPYTSPLHTSALVVERNAFIGMGGYDVRFSMHEDDQLLLRLAEVYVFYVSRRALTLYTSDSQERLTTRRVPLGKLAHFQFCETALATGKASRQFTKCIARMVAHIRDSNVRQGKWSRNREFVKAFPLMAGLVGLEGCCDPVGRMSAGYVAALLRWYLWRIRYYMYTGR